MFSQKRALHESEGHDTDGDTVQNEGADGTAQDFQFDAYRPNDDGTGEYAAMAWAMRQAAKRVCYATVNSNAMNGLVPGTIVSYTMAPWRILVISIDVVIGVFVAAWVVMMVLRGVDAKKHPENYKSKKQKSAN